MNKKHQPAKIEEPVPCWLDKLSYDLLRLLFSFLSTSEVQRMRTRLCSYFLNCPKPFLDSPDIVISNACFFRLAPTTRPLFHSRMKTLTILSMAGDSHPHGTMPEKDDQCFHPSLALSDAQRLQFEIQQLMFLSKLDKLTVRLTLTCTNSTTRVPRVLLHAMLPSAPAGFYPDQKTRDLTLDWQSQDRGPFSDNHKVDPGCWSRVLVHGFDEDNDCCTLNCQLASYRATKELVLGPYTVFNIFHHSNITTLSMESLTLDLRHDGGTSAGFYDGTKAFLPSSNIRHLKLVAGKDIVYATADVLNMFRKCVKLEHVELEGDFESKVTDDSWSLSLNEIVIFDAIKVYAMRLQAAKAKKLLLQVTFHQKYEPPGNAFGVESMLIGMTSEDPRHQHYYADDIDFLAPGSYYRLFGNNGRERACFTKK